MPTVNEMLAALNIDELGPLEAITKLYELKRAAAAEETRAAREIKLLRTRLAETQELTGLPLDDEALMASLLRMKRSDNQR